MKKDFYILRTFVYYDLMRKHAGHIKLKGKFEISSFLRAIDSTYFRLMFFKKMKDVNDYD